jgi:hypothetical protein
MGIQGRFHLVELRGGTGSRAEDLAKEEADRVDNKS